MPLASFRLKSGAAFRSLVNAVAAEVVRVDEHPARSAPASAIAAKALDLMNGGMLKNSFVHWILRWSRERSHAALGSDHYFSVVGRAPSCARECLVTGSTERQP